MNEEENITEALDLLSYAESIICNVDGGIIEKQGESWNKAFRKFEEKYHKFLTHKK